jgi:CHAD domain-containing protein
MRVASRRLRAVLDAYETACDPKKFKKVYGQVKEIADILGKARDTDVMVAHLQQQLAQTPDESQAGLQWLIQHLSTYRQTHQEKLEAFLQALDQDAFTQQMMACLSEGEHKHGKG